MVYRGFSVPSLKGEIRRAPDLAKDLHRTLDCVIGGPTLQLLLPHVADACRRAQQVRTAADAAAALNLTAREVEVLQLLAEGLLARTIAARLGLSPRTVHKHLSNVYTKLGVHDRLVAVSIARAQGLIAA